MYSYWVKQKAILKQKQSGWQFQIRNTGTDTVEDQDLQKKYRKAKEKKVCRERTVELAQFMASIQTKASSVLGLPGKLLFL